MVKHEGHERYDYLRILGNLIAKMEQKVTRVKRKILEMHTFFDFCAETRED